MVTEVPSRLRGSDVPTKSEPPQGRVVVAKFVPFMATHAFAEIIGRKPAASVTCITDGSFDAAVPLALRSTV